MNNPIKIHLMMAELDGIIKNISEFKRNYKALASHKNPGELIHHAYTFNQMSIIMQDFSFKLKYIGKPHMIPPEWHRGNQDTFLKLHITINHILKKYREEYDGYKYNYGHLYQSLDMLNIFGSRETEVRYKEYGLDTLLTAEDRILDIGANCGFMLIYSAFKNGCSGDCIEWNKYMMEIGQVVADHLGFSESINFYSSKFQDFKPAKKYTVIFSFASHWTNDEGLRLSLYDHMKLIYDMLDDGGTAVFETQGGEYLDPGFAEKLEPVKELFVWEEPVTIDSWRRQVYIMKKVL